MCDEIFGDENVCAKMFARNYSAPQKCLQEIVRPHKNACKKLFGPTKMHARKCARHNNMFANNVRDIIICFARNCSAPQKCLHKIIWCNNNVCKIASVRRIAHCMKLFGPQKCLHKILLVCVILFARNYFGVIKILAKNNVVLLLCLHVLRVCFAYV
jgi:hypothetical protein